eukprot:CAMPEP_0179607274 /NCGR_PEP_ID=MMETSP0930-20121108/1853_1 /TAXON_ID=548131 ORGANISM="Ostreococcus mediterraneus, Strain clade-D-RCC1621" /NCGR_SAMPLE_ID=MMETSP0930 /ASSEMBLY_ACC=CAM_ASM_000580 /LENGTH=35 /DNA_ID= /DNA_START= /DNA_END= /DNA_ORIENTATION=
MSTLPAARRETFSMSRIAPSKSPNSAFISAAFDDA